MRTGRNSRGVSRMSHHRAEHCPFDASLRITRILLVKTNDMEAVSERHQKGATLERAYATTTRGVTMVSVVWAVLEVVLEVKMCNAAEEAWFRV
jgi:hypothetical protein